MNTQRGDMGFVLGFVVLWIQIAVVAAFLDTSSELYVGCFGDFPPDQAMELFIDFISTRTIENCVRECGEKGKRYAGLQNGGNCYCGDRYVGNGQEALSACDTPCTGRSSQICGGYQRNSVYRVPCPEHCATLTSCYASRDCTGCASGYYGSRCQYSCSRNKCPGNCAQNNGNCYECNAGMYGPTCEYSCPSNCASSCHQITGVCTSCTTPYWGDTCTSQCHQNCVGSCVQSTGKCRACKKGWFGDMCTSSCSNCVQTCNRQHGDCTTCVSRYWGHGCTETCNGNCTETCEKRSGKCDDCPASKWGFYCEYMCDSKCAQSCDRNSGFCLQCGVGLWGEHCEKTCADNCLDSCNKETGKCDSCNNDTLWGDTCTDICPGNCDGTCDRETGYCDQCKPGFHGKNCSLSCGKCQGDICDKESGSCPVCQPGYYGDTCESSCPHCKDELCEKSNGSCSSGCEAGYYLDSCNATCPENCKTQCDRKDGDCSYGCNEGYYGTRCTNDCLGNCKDKQCNQTDGLCPNGCQNGYFGEFCNNTCLGNCANDECNRSDGSCVEGCTVGYYGFLCNVPCFNCKGGCDESGRCKHGCKPGWKGENCTKSCPGGSFGEHCAGTCHCAENVTCDAVSGHCPDGCADGWTGQACAEIQMQQGAGGTSGGTLGGQTGVIAGVGAAAGVVVLLVIVIVVIVHRRYKKRQKYKSGQDNEAVTFHNLQNGTSHDEPSSNGELHQGDLETVIGNGRVEPGKKKAPEEQDGNSPSVPSVKLTADALKQHIAHGKLSAEYANLPSDKQHPWEAANKAANKKKNRYRGIQPYDHNRVVLSKLDGDPTSDYINASYVPSYTKERGFIALQGATKCTVEDTWRMVWHVQASIIVMVTTLTEGKKVKCVQYWPDAGSQSYGDVTVVMEQQTVKADYTSRRFKLKKDGEDRVVHQLHFTGWPDHGVPDSATPLINFRHVVRKQQKDDATQAPVVVHCSAGIGRTGTYIGLDYLLEQAEEQHCVDVPACVRKLRHARVNMVQNVDQYLFLYQALWEGMTIGCTLLTKDNAKDLDTLAVEAQHKLLTGKQKQPESKKGARSACEEGMMLSSKPFSPSLPERLVICQSVPASDQVAEFWEEVFTNKWSSIVLLMDTDKQQAKSDQDWLPKSDAPIHLPSGIEVEVCSREDGHESWSAEVKLKVQDKEYANVEAMKQEETYYNVGDMQNSRGRTLRVTGIKYDSPADYITAWTYISESPQVIVLCSTSLEQGCVFATSMFLLDQAKAFDDADVYSAVETIRKADPHLFTAVNDYHLLYKVLQCFHGL